MACVAVNSLMRTIELEFLQPQPRPIVEKTIMIPKCKELFQSLHQKLGSLIELFDEKRIVDSVASIEHLEIMLRDLAFLVENDIEYLVLFLYELEERKNGRSSSGHRRFWFWFCSSRNDWQDLMKRAGYISGINRDPLKLLDLIKQAIDVTDIIEEKLIKIRDDYRPIKYQQRTTITTDDFHISDEVKNASNSEEKMVGRDDEFKAIWSMLIQHPSRNREVVSIKGMAGIGKTTLARRVYEDQSVASYFDKQAWVTVSQYHNKRQVLVVLLKSISKHNSEADVVSDGDLALRLYQGLKGRRYLVVLDDIWSGEAWDNVKTCFPSDENGSRVLLTTRLEEVVNYTRSDHNFSLQMQFLDQNESWNLFREKAFRCRDAEFDLIGRQIVEKCRGLPLAIVVVAGLFSRLNTLQECKAMAESLYSYPTTIDEECSKLLSWSYNHLSHNLKACFLYLGVFREDEEINANDLARLWAAEGLVKKLGNESYDEVARRYIQEFNDRNLIIVSKWSCCGRKIKEFHIHDLLHAFCVKKATQEHLLHIIRDNGSNFFQNSFRWLSIQSSGVNVRRSYSPLYGMYNFRSIIYCQCSSSKNWSAFYLLRVLYSPRYYSNDNITDSLHLRYTNSTDFDLNLFKARNLQTLRVSRDNGRNYLDFPQLQYIKCYFVSIGCLEFVHENLQSISWLRPDHCTEEFFSNIPRVKVVKISGERRDCNKCIGSLTRLRLLEKLYIHANESLHPSTIPINNNIVFLEHLTKLSFGNMRFAWSEISILCQLPRLEVLRLFGHACIGEEWELSEEESFHRLICLEIGLTDLKHWQASADNFPKLEHLLLYSCRELEEIPSGFGEIPMLKSIELKKCLGSAVASAELIKEEQCEYGNEHTVVIVKDIIQLDDSDEDELEQR